MLLDVGWYLGRMINMNYCVDRRRDDRHDHRPRDRRKEPFEEGANIGYTYLFTLAFHLPRAPYCSVDEPDEQDEGNSCGECSDQDLVVENGEVCHEYSLGHEV